ncbi:MAG: DUF721 domain-containing protein [Ignavibacteriales bacterium]|jgi:hypothetical protein|nr:DUF721 domain-containing protein [Ignavibacteriales bacterium]MBK7981138.1 DUF721 domain-containing protein [Ignavibacteriota bacterium]
MLNSFRSLTEVFNNENTFEKFRKSVKEIDVLEGFHAVFPDLKKTVKPKYVKKGILFLSAENSVLKNELFLNRKLIVEKINNHFKEKIITDIKF